MITSKEIAREIGQRYIDEINDMRVIATEEVSTVNELLECLSAIIPRDSINYYLMGKKQNSFIVELVEHKLSNGYLAQDIRLTEKMTEVKTSLFKLSEGETYTAEAEDYLITDNHTLSDIIRFCIEQSSPEEVKCLIEEMGRAK